MSTKKPSQVLGIDIKGRDGIFALTQFYQDRVEITVGGQTVAVDADSFWAALETFRMVGLPSDWPGHINVWKPGRDAT